MSATDDNRERRRTAAEGVRRIVMRLVRVHRRQSLRTLMLSLLAAATEGIGILVLIPLLSLLGMATQAGGAWLELPFVEAVSGNLVVVVAVFLGLLSLRQLSVYFQRLDVMRTRLDFSKELRLDLLAALAGAKWERFSAGTLHRQVQILTLDSHRAGDAAQHCFGLAAAGFVALVQIVVAIWLSPTFTLIVLSTTALVILVLARQLRRVNSLGEQLTERYDAIYKLTMNFVPMLRTAKMSGTTGTLLKRFRSENDRMNDVVASYVAHHTASTVSIQLAAGVVLSICIVLWMSVFSLGALEMSLLIVIFARLVPVLGQTLQLVQNLVHDLPAVENALSNIEDWRAQADDAPELVTTPVPRPRNSIELRSVSGGYAAADASPVLDGVSFSMPVGKLTLLSGPTGAGKSTIADVLSGLLRPAAGAIFVDGNPLSWRQIPDWRRVVGYVDQDTMLLTGSVRENLAWGAEELDGGRLERALRIAAVDEFIDDLPGGLEAPVGEYGSRLSGGQRQRIAIARELLRLPRLLILDEATSGLDLATEALLLERLRASDDQMTTLLISHRRSSLEYADVVVIVDKGRIVEVKADALGDRRADEPTEYSESIGLRVSG